MGIAMGEPYFQCREKLAEADAVVCSANFALYSDLSGRIMSILEDSLPEVQQYSIDEAFAVVDDGDWEPYCRELRKKIRRWTGITVSVGIAPTRTLCKLANETAKHHPEMQGVCNFCSADKWEPWLPSTPVEDVWGVGRRLAPRMRSFSLRTAADIAAASLDWMRRRFGVHGERLTLELRGNSCFEEESQSTRGQVMVSRSLKEGVTELLPLRDVLCQFVEKAGRILRDEQLMASQVFVVLRTSRFKDAAQSYSSHQGVSLPHYTDDTRLFIRCATALLEALYKPGYEYKKIGVLLTGLEKVENVHPTFDQPDVKPSRLMKVLDSLQKKGHNIGFANYGNQPLWHKEHLSRGYTTNWADIPETSRD